MDSRQKSSQLTQLVIGAREICSKAQKVLQLDSSALRSCDAFVPNIKEEGEDSEYGVSSATVCPNPVSSSTTTQPVKSPRLVENHRLHQFPPKAISPFPWYMTTGYPMIPGQTMYPITRNMQPYGPIGPQVAVRPQMSHSHWLFLTNCGIRDNTNQADQQPGNTISTPPVQSLRETIQSPTKVSFNSAPIIKEEPMDEIHHQVEASQKSFQALPSPIPQVSQGYMPYLSQVYPFMGLSNPFPMPTRLQMKRKSQTIGRKAKLQKDEDDKDFIDLYKSVEVAALVGKHPVLLYKFKKDDGDCCYPFTRKRVNQSGEVYSCSNCKKLGEKETFIRVKNGYFQSNPVEGHGPTCEPKKWIEEMVKRMTYKTTQRVKMNDYDVDTKEIHSQMCADVLANDSLSQEEKVEVFNIIGNFPSKCRSIARARKMSKQRQDEQEGLLNEMLARQMMIFPHLMMYRPQMFQQVQAPIIKIEEDSKIDNITC